jgi:hypothetical protein
MPIFKIERFANGPTRSLLNGKGVGDDIQAGRSIKLSRKLQDRYNIMNCYDQHPEEVYIMNKILKDLIQNTQVISQVPKQYVRIFQGLWDGSTVSSEYNVLVEFE